MVRCGMSSLTKSSQRNRSGFLASTICTTMSLERKTVVFMLKVGLNMLKVGFNKKTVSMLKVGFNKKSMLKVGFNVCVCMCVCMHVCVGVHPLCVGVYACV